jgi:hypothetical protein
MSFKKNSSEDSIVKHSESDFESLAEEGKANICERN